MTKNVKQFILTAHKKLLFDYSHEMIILIPFLCVNGTYKVIFIKAFTEN